MSIMLPPEPSGNNRVSPGWRAGDLTPADIRNLLDNFVTKFAPGDDDECWLWQGTRMPSGYGVLGRSYRAPLLAHRVSWVAFSGIALSGNLTIDHLCNVKACVNPAHLEPVTMSENNRRKNERLGHTIGTKSGAKKPCPDCGLQMRADTIRRHRKRKHAEELGLTGAVKAGA